MEFACCLPLMSLILTGLWQVGCITQTQQVMWNSSREAARDCSLGQDNLLTVATNLQNYLQGAAPSIFIAGHSTSMISPVITLPANNYGYTCWDNTANRELYTFMFTDLTNTSVTDPTNMSQLDLYQITVTVPYSTVAWTTITPVPGISRLYASVTWASMVDSPFSITPSLPAQ
jgi:hypothetical protein